MPETIDREQYGRRTIQFYRGMGGIFTDLANVFDEMLADPQYKKKSLPEPVKLLNIASYWKDTIEQGEEGKKVLEWLPDEGDKLMLCVLGCIGINNPDIQKNLRKNWVNDDVYYPKFKPIMDKWADKSMVSVYIKQNELLAKEIDTLNERVKMQSELIGYHLDSIQKLLSAKDALPYDVGYAVDGSDLNDALSFEGIMKWVEEHPFKTTRAVIDMVEDFMMMVKTTDKQRSRMMNVKKNFVEKVESEQSGTQNISNGGVIVMNGADANTTVYGGDAKKNVAAAKTNADDSKDVRLEKALKAIEKRLEHFVDTMLWHDDEGRQMKSYDLIRVFNKCLGYGCQLNNENHKKAAEILSDKLFTKRGNEGLNEDGYEPVTVLNILGYFKANGLIDMGLSDREITKIIVPKDKNHFSDQSYESMIGTLTRHVSKGKKDIFKDIDADYLDYRIAELKKDLKQRTPSKKG